MTEEGAVTTPDEREQTDARAGRAARLEQDIRRLMHSVDRQQERWLRGAGIGLMVLGVACIGLAWRGVSRTPLGYEQNSYLISGGGLGLAFVIAGAAVYVGHWHAVRIRVSREQTRELLAALRSEPASPVGLPQQREAPAEPAAAQSSGAARRSRLT